MILAVIIELPMPDDWTVRSTPDRGEGVLWPLLVLDSPVVMTRELTYEADLTLIVTALAMSTRFSEEEGKRTTNHYLALMDT